MAAMSRVIIVSNRLPITASVKHGRLSVAQSTGGLATGLHGLHRDTGGLWIGWPGDTTGMAPDEATELDRLLADRSLVPCPLTQDEVSAYHSDFANGVLWPLFHYLLDRMPYQPRDFEVYRRVNERFADLVAAHYRPGDTIWIHDYQLAVVPAFVRDRLPQARIGFFLHIPFPTAEVLRILPWREELLRGLLGADLVGFHTLSYARHFANSLIHLLGLTPDVDRVTYDARTVRFGAFPMGIEAAAFEAKARSPETIAEATRIRRENGAEHLLLGVDRLDYTKGIPRRLLAVERLLQKHPELRGKVCLVQVAVPSRTEVGEYAAFTADVNRLVGRLNGEFGTPTSVPVHYLYRAFTQQELVAMYRAADVMLVTPLRDGMNLVAKEFVASRPDEDGVLVLSEFAGAAAEMGEASLVNPYDIDACADAIHAAITVAATERRARMRALRDRVRRFDVHRWARTFLDALEEANVGAFQGSPEALDRTSVSPVAERVAQAERVLLLLDYDGTLVPLASRPELAVPGDELLALLAALVRHPRNMVHVVSGRPHKLLEEWFGQLELGLHAEHGLWSRDPGGRWRMNWAGDVAWKPRVLEILEQVTARTPGSTIEEKDLSVAWHYRMCDSEFGEWQAKELKIHLTHALSNVPVTVLSGNKVVEVQPHGIHKGLVATQLCRAFPNALPIALGDDETDENLFAALPVDAITIHVGSRPSRARYNVRDAKAVRRLLAGLTGAGDSTPPA